MSRPPARAWERYLWLVAPCLALLAYRSITSFEFVGDARFLILENRYGHSLDFFGATLRHDYFWSSSGNVIPYWRPVTRGSWLLEWQLFHAWAGGYLLVNLAWHALGSVGVFALARKCRLARLPACAAAVSYALHPIAIEAVSLIMARSDVVVAACSTWALVSWLAWRREPVAWKRRAFAALHVVCVALALGSKEVALVLPLVLAGFIAFEGAPRPWRRRALELSPAIAVAAGYWLVRRHVLENEADGLSRADLSFDILRITSSIAFYLRESWPLSLGSSLRELPIAETKSAFFLAKTVATSGAFAAAILFAIRRREGAFGALLAWTLLALAPVVLPRAIAVVTESTKYPLADRWLGYALAPALVAWVWLAVRAGAWLARARRVPARRLRLGGSSVVVAWACLMLFESTPARAELGSDRAMLDNEDRVFYQAIPEAYRTEVDRCRHEERLLARDANDAELTVDRAEHALERCPQPEMRVYLLDALVRLRRFEDAEPIARALVAEPPRDRRSHGRIALLVGVTLLQRGHFAEARRAFETALRLGQGSCQSLLSVAEAARGRDVDEAASAAESAFECGGRRDPSLLLAGATWLTSAGRIERARVLLTRARTQSLSPDQAAQAATLERVLGGKSGELLVPVPASPSH